ncbi:site-specific integrase [Paraburkholderia mimosarum]|uniref:site-specific integrase n=1 Tax=Paraburkholderia mimosarum TaxID=312026 RepID=UPI0003FC90F9|nr:site-specific integrase [Paraburkholderia mimosarum]
MFAKYFESRQRIDELAAKPESNLLEEFTLRLWEIGYAGITARRHLRAAEHLLYWTHKNRIASTNISPDIIRRFGNHLSRCTCLRYGHADREGVMHGVRLFTDYLQEAGAMKSFNSDDKPMDPELLVQFRRWMLERRGTKDSTLSTYSISIRNLLRTAGTNPATFTARQLRRFVLNESARQGLAATKNCTTALRMFLRFLIAEGKCRAGLDASVPTVANWCLSSLPRYIHADDVEKVLASCDRTTPVGIRDYAIVLMLARLGLRAGDLVRLRLGDIDWKNASISITGKSGRPMRFPLLMDIGHAIVDYLRRARPPSGTDALFVGCRAPFNAFASHCAVSVIVERAMRRSGVVCPSGGAAHVLRHSVATSMLRDGTSLQDIAVVLGHRSSVTTQIYAKVDLPELQKIAQPWPETQSC